MLPARGDGDDKGQLPLPSPSSFPSCVNCSRYGEKLALAANAVKASNEELQKILAQKRQMKETFTAAQTLTMAKVAGLKRDLVQATRELRHLTSNNAAMLSRVQGTLYSLQQLGLGKGKDQNVAEVLATVKHMSLNLEEEKAKLIEQLTISNAQLKVRNMQLEKSEKTVHEMKTEFHKTQVERQKFLEFHQKYKLKKERVRLAEKGVLDYKKRNAALTEQLREKDAHIADLTSDLKEKVKNNFILNAQLKEKEREEKTLRTVDSASTSSGEAGRTPIELQDLTTLTPPSTSSLAKKPRLAFDDIITGGASRILTFCDTLSLQEHKFIIERIALDLEKAINHKENSKQKLSEAEERTKAANEEVFAMKEEFALQEQTKDALHSDLAKLSQDHENATTEVTVLKQENAQLLKEQRTMRQEIRRTQKLLNSANERIASDQSKLDAVHFTERTTQDRCAQLRRELDSTEAQLRQMFDDNRKMQECLASQKEEMTKLTMDYDFCVNRRSDLIRQLEAENRTLTADNEALRRVLGVKGVNKPAAPSNPQWKNEHTQQSENLAGQGPWNLIGQGGPNNQFGPGSGNFVQNANFGTDNNPGNFAENRSGFGANNPGNFGRNAPGFVGANGPVQNPGFGEHCAQNAANNLQRRSGYEKVTLFPS